MSEHQENNSASHAEQNRQHLDEHAETHSTFTEKNREHWNKTASTYASEPWQKDMINKTHAFLLAHLSWLGVPFLDPSTAFEETVPAPNSTTNNTDHAREVRVLDYACGPGTITAILASHASHFIGIDLSENMVAAYNARFAATEGATQTLNAHAVVGDLLSPTLSPSLSSSDQTFHSFDLVAVGFGFHHFADLTLATERLVARLRPGGVLLIVDFVAHAHTAQVAAANHNHNGHGDYGGAEHTIAHHGFGEAEVRKYFGAAGLVEVDVLTMPEPVRMMVKTGEGREERERWVFLAKGRKPKVEG